MKSLKNYIVEAFKINKNTKLEKHYKYFPKTTDKLKAIINKRIKLEGSKCDLNDIDTSKITDMTSLFLRSDFNGDISKWDVSNVRCMTAMFTGSEFNGDISNWDVSNVKSMTWMFEDSHFNQDISNWNVSNVTDMRFMFRRSEFDQDISNWDVSNVSSYVEIFDNCPIEEKYKPKFK